MINNSQNLIETDGFLVTGVEYYLQSGTVEFFDGV